MELNMRPVEELEEFICRALETKKGQFNEFREVISDELRKKSECYYKIGKALREVRDNDFYRAGGYKSFEKCCRKEWDISRSRAYQYIAAVDTIDNLSTRVDIFEIPESERLIRPLTKLDSETQISVWNNVVATGETITTKLVQRVVNEYLPKKKPVKEESEVLKDAKERPTCLDEFIYSQTIENLEADHRRETYDYKEEIKRLRKINQRLVKEVDELRKALHQENIFVPECATHAPSIYIVD